MLRTPFLRALTVLVAAGALLSPPAPAQTVTLHSVVISGTNVTVTYTKNFTTCAHLMLANFQLVHTANWFCPQGTNVAVTVPLSAFSANFAVGVQVKLCHGNNYNICSALVTVTAAATLTGQPPAISLAAGGTHQLLLDAGPASAGLPYALAGSVSGTVPGFSLGPFVVPLNPDPYFELTLLFPNTFPFAGFQGVLGASGTATASLTLPPGMPPAYNGLTVDHAAAVAAVSGEIVAVTAAVSLVLVP